MEVIQAVVDELSDRCQCNFEADLISSAGFRCFPQSPTAVTFRALMTGSPQATAQELAIFLGDWISSGAFLTIQAQLLSVDGSCAITISSFGESECNPVEETPATSTGTTTPSSSPSGVSVTVIGSVAAVAVLVVLVVIVILSLIVVTLKRKKRYSFKPPVPPLPIQP